MHDGDHRVDPVMWQKLQFVRFALSENLEDLKGANTLLSQLLLVRGWN